MNFDKPSRSIIMSNVNHSAIRIEPFSDAVAWDEFVIQHNGHLLQSFEWGELKSRFGWRAERWVQQENSRICAGAQILYRRLLPGLELAYVPRGPVNANAEFLLALGTVLRTRGVFLLKVEPDWLHDDSRNQILAAAGLRPSPDTIQPPATIQIDLTHDLDAILAAMKPKWRYNIRLAEKKGVVVRTGTAADLPAFYELSRITAERDRFGIHGQDYYRTAFELLMTKDAVRLLIAEYEGQNLAMIFITAFGHEAIYLYGASGNEHRNVMPNHALHWAAIQWAKSCGCVQYDLWGVPKNAGAESHDQAPLPDSLYQFKQGFGGTVVEYTGAWDFVYGLLQHQVYRAARKVRRGGLG